jgi:hypothetical protein
MAIPRNTDLIFYLLIYRVLAHYNRGSFVGGKAAGREADHSPPSSAEVEECVELSLHFPNTSSWRGA